MRLLLQEALEVEQEVPISFEDVNTRLEPFNAWVGFLHSLLKVNESCSLL